MALSKNSFKLNHNKKELTCVLLQTRCLLSFFISSKTTKILVNVVEGDLLYKSAVKPFSIGINNRFYACNKFPKGKLKKEAVSIDEVLLSRLIDRSIRPMFPLCEKFFSFSLVLVEYGFEEEIFELGLIGVSVALTTLFGLKPFVPLEVREGDTVLRACAHDGGVTMLDFDGNHLTKDIMRHLYLLDTKPLTQSFEDHVKARVNVPPLKLDQDKIGLIAVSLLGEIKREERGLTAELMEELKSKAAKSFSASTALVELGSVKALRVFFAEKQERTKRNIEVLHVGTLNSTKLLAKEKTSVISSITVGFKEDSYEDVGINDEKNHKMIYSNYMFNSFAVGRSDKRPTTRREIGHGHIIERVAKRICSRRDLAIRIVTDVLSADGSTSITGCIGASICLKENNFAEDTVRGITVGEIANRLWADLTELEDAASQMDIKIVICRGRVLYMQMDRSEKPISLERLREAIEFGVAEAETTEIVYTPKPAKILEDSVGIEQEKVKNLFAYNGMNIKKVLKMGVKISVRGTLVHLISNSLDKIEVAKRFLLAL